MNPTTRVPLQQVTCKATVQFSWVEASQAFSLYLIEGPFAFPVSHMTDLGLCPQAGSRTNHRAQTAQKTCAGG